MTASVTDAAGNSADAVSDTLTLDTTADLEDDTDLAVSVDTVINDVESGNVTLTLSGVDADGSFCHGHTDRRRGHCGAQPRRSLATTVTGRLTSLAGHS